ncbi:MAG TPA: hypothetical protein VF609_14120, partial [Flavisolibacter sp.]
MPLRKSKNTATGRSTNSRKLRTTLPGKKAGRKEEEISIDIKRQKDLQWTVEQVRRDFQHKKRSLMPVEAKPMLASVIDEPFNDENWQFEIKWDGYRA